MNAIIYISWDAAFDPLLQRLGQSRGKPRSMSGTPMKTVEGSRHKTIKKR